MTTCGCGCGAAVPTRRGKRYVDERHKQRAYRQRVQERMRAVGRRPRLGVTVYLPTIELAEALLDHVDGLDDARDAITKAIERRRTRS